MRIIIWTDEFKKFSYGQGKSEGMPEQIFKSVPACPRSRYSPAFCSAGDSVKPSIISGARISDESLKLSSRLSALLKSAAVFFQ